MSFSWQLLLAAFVVIIILKKVSFLNFYLKFFLTYSSVIIISTLHIPYYVLRPKNVLNLLTTTLTLRLITKRVAGVSYTVKGEEHLRKDRSCVVVANHQSSIDLIGMIEIWRIIGRMTVLAKREIMLVGTFGIACWLAGITFINRNAGEKTGHAINNTMKELKRKGIKLWVFPEGTRRNTGEIHSFKKGAFHAAIQAQVPIVPVVFSSYKYFLDTKNKIFNEGRIIVSALPEIPTEGLTTKDVDGLIERTRNMMIKEYNEISKEASKV